jgi:two-component system response regulator RegX3
MEIKADKPETVQILIIEDEEAIAEGLVDLCGFRGYKATHVADGESGLSEALTGKYDLVILDIMLPKMDGFTVCDRVRERDRELPIIILSAKTSDTDIVDGLRLGADDYVSKPFSVTQLFARMEAVLRRSRKNMDAENYLQLGDLHIHFREFLGMRNDVEIPFTRKEMEIMQYLSRHRNRAVSRQELLREVWGYENAESVDTRTVDIHVTKIRKKVEKTPASPTFLVTLRGEGYLLRIPHDEA